MTNPTPTPEDRATAAFALSSVAGLIAAIRDAEAAARADEREACEAIAREEHATLLRLSYRGDDGSHCIDTAGRIARAIRARGEEKYDNNRESD